MQIQTVNFLDIPFIAMSSQDILKLIQIKIEAKEPLKVCYIDEKRLMKSFFSSSVRQNILSFNVIIPRSAFICKQIKKVYPDYLYQDEDCLDMLSPIFEKYKSTSNAFMLFGSSQLGLNKLGINLQASFKGIRLIGCYSKSFIEARTDAVRSMIHKGDVRVIFFGMGTPFDEKWVQLNQDILNNITAICVNKEIQILTGEIKEIPIIYRKKGKEFSYLISHNWLYLFTVPRFFYIKIKTFFFKLKVNKKFKE